MLIKRIIPCLLLSNRGLVKTTKFSNPKYIGDPINAIRIFNEKEVDELIVLDILASKYKKQPDYSLLEKIAGECFMPLCYGGGIKTFTEAQKLYKLGFEKISLQTAALEDVSIIRQISEKAGSQSVVVSVDIKRDRKGNHKVYLTSKGKISPVPWMEYLETIIEAGAGEVIINSVDNDGMMHGMDLDLIRIASKVSSVPVIALGGVGSLSHIKDAFEAGASAVSAGAYFVFYGPNRAVLITYPDQESIRSL